ncbi:MAG: hypothetical protein IJF76_04665 [Clostridia bacterium]|nr:hypothetical protein [Clostridia bacterium]
MGLFSKMGYNSKARAIAKKREMQELIDLDFDSLVQKISEIGDEDFSLFVDLTLYAYYRFPCAYTASNVIAVYVDIYSGRQIDETVELPDYEFFVSVGNFLEKASQVKEVFDEKAYYTSLAQYYLLTDKTDFKSAFSVLVNMPTNYMDAETQYLTGMMYYMLGMSDMAKKVLETSLDDMSGEAKKSASLAVAKLNKCESEDVEELLRSAFTSNSEAVQTESARLLNEIGKSNVIVENFDFAQEDTNIRLYREVAIACKNTDNLDKFKPIYDTYEGDALYDTVYEKVLSGETVDVDQTIRAVLREKMDMIADSELYEFADDTTRRMLNNEIMRTSQSDEDFSLREYIAFTANYLK